MEEMENRKDPAVDEAAARQLAALLQLVNAQGNRDFMPQESGQKAKPINVMDLFWYIFERLQYVVIVAVLAAVLGGVYGFSTSSATYTATSKLYLLGQGTTIQTYNLSLSSMMSIDFVEVFKTWEVHEMVRDALGLNYSYGAMQSMISVSIPNGSRVMYITARNSDPQLAADLANEYATAARNFILKTMDVDEPSMFSMALVPGSAAGTSKASFITKGFAAGLILSVGLLSLLYMIDDRPKTPEDIQRVAALDTLAVVPASRLEKRSSSAKRRKSS